MNTIEKLLLGGDRAIEFLNIRQDDATPAKRIIEWNGFRIGLQYLPFELRHGKVLTAGYGHFQKTKGADNMALDVYVGTKLESPKIYAIAQYIDGQFDEEKLVIGVETISEAKDIYLSAMPKEFFGAIREITLEELKNYRFDSTAIPQTVRTSEDIRRDFAAGILSRADALRMLGYNDVDLTDDSPFPTPLLPQLTKLPPYFWSAGELPQTVGNIYAINHSQGGVLAIGFDSEESAISAFESEFNFDIETSADVTDLLSERFDSLNFDASKKVVKGNLCRDERGRFISCGKPVAKVESSLAKKRRENKEKRLKQKSTVPATEVRNAFKSVPVKRLNIEAKLSDYDKDEIENLAQSILKNGVQSPIIATRDGRDYRVEAGEKIAIAAKRAREIDPHGGEKINIYIAENEEEVTALKFQMKYVAEPSGKTPLDVNIERSKTEVGETIDVANKRLVAVSRISTKDAGKYDKDEVENLAQSMLRVGQVVPIVVQSDALGRSYTSQGGIALAAAKRAREIDPKKGEMISVFVARNKDQEVALSYQIRRDFAAAGISSRTDASRMLDYSDVDLTDDSPSPALQLPQQTKAPSYFWSAGELPQTTGSIYAINHSQGGVLAIGFDSEELAVSAFENEFDVDIETSADVTELFNDRFDSLNLDASAKNVKGNLCRDERGRFVSCGNPTTKVESSLSKKRRENKEKRVRDLKDAFKNTNFMDHQQVENLGKLFSEQYLKPISPSTKERKLKKQKDALGAEINKAAKEGRTDDVNQLIKDFRKVEDDWVQEYDKRQGRLAAQYDQLKNAIKEHHGLSKEQLKGLTSTVNYELGAINKKNIKEYHAELLELTGGKSATSIKKVFYSDPRAYANMGGDINVGKGARKDTFFHEAGHHIEFESFALKNAALGFRASKATSNEPQSLAELTGIKAYRDNEKALHDKFIDPYVGKVYRDGSTEVISMGVEQFHSARSIARFREKDKRHFEFTVGVLLAR